MVLTRILILSLIGSFFTCFANPAETTPKPSGRVAVQSVCAAPDLTAACLNAGDIWARINEVNLVENILPTRDRADLVISKAANHDVTSVRLRKI